ncbi:unnamed protein product [Paramecium sonneborni]|uniref:Phosphatase 2A Regulatory Subunit A helical domain-containing protein n=1 Tax=Paramecium sonneborni TaxID=65129 RepID=A0A8S1RKZ9_9CILI|nr:unnamed protein product [Paramecium sonneborni]
MGNTLIDNRGRLDLMKSFETHNTEQDIGVRQRRLSDNKLLKSIHYKMHHQNLVVKVYLILKKLTHNELYIHFQNFQYLMEQFDPYPNLMAFLGLINFGKIEKPSPQEMQNECNKDYLAISRQMLYMTLEERLQSNYKLPKCILNFYILQLLSAVKTLHNINCYPGHIRSSNILLTSLDYLVLTDFASYKPYYTNEFEVIRNVYESSIQKCTLAPEKYADNQEIQSIVNLTKESIQNLQKWTCFQQDGLFMKFIQVNVYLHFNNYYNIVKENLILLSKLKGSQEIQYAIQLIQMQINVILLKKHLIYFIIQFVNMILMNQFKRFVMPLILKESLCILMSELLDSDKLLLHFNPNNGIIINIQSEHPNKLPEIRFKTPQNSITLAGQIENSENLIYIKVKCKTLMMMPIPYFHNIILCQKSKQSGRNILFDSVKNNINKSQNEYILFILWIFNSIRNCRFLQTRLCGLELAEYFLEFIDDSSMYKLIIPNLGQFCEDYEGQTQLYAFSIFLDLLKRSNYPYSSQTEAFIFKLYICGQIKTRLQDMSQNPMLGIKIGDIALVLQ